MWLLEQRLLQTSFEVEVEEQRVLVASQLGRWRLQQVWSQVVQQAQRAVKRWQQPASLPECPVMKKIQ